MENERLFKEEWATKTNGPVMPEDTRCNQSLPPKSMQDRLNESYDRLRFTKTELHEASEMEYKTKAYLKEKETGLLMSGAIIGKNQEARAAELAACTKEESLAVEMSRSRKMETQLRFELAQLEVERLKWLCRADIIARDGYFLKEG